MPILYRLETIHPLRDTDVNEGIWQTTEFDDIPSTGYINNITDRRNMTTASHPIPQFDTGFNPLPKNWKDYVCGAIDLNQFTHWFSRLDLHSEQWELMRVAVYYTEELIIGNHQVLAIPEKMSIVDTMTVSDFCTLYKQQFINKREELDCEIE